MCSLHLHDNVIEEVEVVAQLLNDCPGILQLVLDTFELCDMFGCLLAHFGLYFHDDFTLILDIVNRQLFLVLRSLNLGLQDPHLFLWIASLWASNLAILQLLGNLLHKPIEL